LDYCDIESSTVTFHSIFYFVVVTLSTVGYGDITMHSNYAKGCVILLVGLAVVVIPNQTNEVDLGHSS
jgi:hypothetical protein